MIYTMTNNTSNAAEQGQAPDQQPPAQAATSDGQAPNESPTTTISLTIVEDLQRQIADLRKENAAHRKAKQDAQSVAQQAEEARLKEQGEYKQLAERHEAR